MTLAIRAAHEVPGEPAGQLMRHVLFAPSLGNSKYQRMAVVTAPPGARGQPHTHPGNEAIYTLQGEITYEIGGQLYRVSAGHALMIPPNTVHPGHVTSDVPWVSVCFYCDECPALATYRASGGALREEKPRVVRPEDIPPEQLGELRRWILFTPSRDGVNFLRLGVAEGLPGAKGAVHSHPGNECFMTLSGQATLMINGEAHIVNANYGIAIPPATEHPLTVTSAEKWTAVACYCDECPLLKSRGK